MSELYAAGGKVIGPSHANIGANCEDSFIYDFSADREWFWGIVSDGCGSASRAKEGSEFLTQKLIAPLGELAADISKRGPGDWVIDEVVLTIANLRKSMRAEFQEQILDYSATLVAVVCSSSGGFFIHLGDGIGLALSQSGEPTQGTLKEIARTNPENGEYINETFYLTESNWLHHLRISPFGKWDLLILCTDGAQDLLFNGIVAEPEPIESLIGSLSFSKSDDEMMIENFFGHPLAQSKSGDDKTCLILAHKDLHSRGIDHWKLLPKEGGFKTSSKLTEKNIEAKTEKNIHGDVEISNKITRRIKIKNTSVNKIKKLLNYSLLTFVTLIIIGLSLLIYFYESNADNISGETKLEFKNEKKENNATEVKLKVTPQLENKNKEKKLENKNKTTNKAKQILDLKKQENSPTDRENPIKN
jgi:serine/threonine protein phosphatase PrpC